MPRPMPTLMDGAMGTELLALGHRPPLWRAPARDVLMVHQRYFDAGARVLVTNTLTLPADADYQLVRPKGRELCLLGSLGPLAESPNFPDREEVIARVRHLQEADAILLETCSDESAFDAANWICEEFPNRIVFASFAFRPGEEKKAAAIARRANASETVSALGVNCGRDQSPADVGRMLRIFRAETWMVLFARPNEGTVPLGPEEWARQTAAICDDELDLRMIGGCCGTTPDHIRAMAKHLAAV